ncbi:MAG TPA: hypothetical protein V6D07_13255 [Trichocoleus sp.]
MTKVYKIQTKIRAKQGGELPGVSLALALMGLFIAGPSQAADFPPCPPPAANEYLLLVRGETEAQRTRIQDLLPANSSVLICNYLGDSVVRGGGFTTLETANAWAQYMTEIEGFQAFVARPASAAEQPTDPRPPVATGGTSTPSPAPSQPAALPSPSPATPSPTTPTPLASPAPAATVTPATSYTPRALGSGFAVLVDYQNQPELAVDIQRRIGQAVGLAVYGQRPYLLIAHSPNMQGAASTLAALSSKSIPAFIVDSQSVVMLTNAVALKAQ